MKNKIPNQLYVLINSDTGIPFYIGISSNPERRMKEHQKDFNTKKCSKFKDVINFHMIVVMKNTNKKFNIKLIETFFIIYDKIMGDKLLKNQYIY